MTLDVEKLKQLRERRGWSQDQLASAAGVSIRTIQRAEKDGTASRETKVCLAAALGVAHQDLEARAENVPQNANSAPILNVSAKTRAAFQHPGWTALGMAFGTFLYHAFVHGLAQETWFKSIFIGGFVFAIFVTLRKLMGTTEPPSQVES